jgi:hypothetical protein
MQTAKKKIVFIKTQLTEFEQYACPLFSFEPSELINVNKYRDELHELNENKKSMTDKLNEFSSYLQKINILDKRGIIPYIDNKVIETDLLPIKRGYGMYEFIIPCITHILLYADIVTTNEKFNDFFMNASITIGDKDFYSTGACTKIFTDDKQNNLTQTQDPFVEYKNIYRLCWNINSMNPKINYDKNALWIPLTQLQYHEVRICVNTYGDIDFNLRFIGIDHEPVVDQVRIMGISYESPVGRQLAKYFIRPNSQFDFYKFYGAEYHIFDKYYQGFGYYNYDNLNYHRIIANYK